MYPGCVVSSAARERRMDIPGRSLVVLILVKMVSSLGELLKHQLPTHGLRSFGASAFLSHVSSTVTMKICVF